jgi:predicted DNA-binding protein (MmcQ/YjbR family)
VTDDEGLARVRAICRALPEASEGELQDRPLFHVRRRRFAIFNGDASPPRPRWDGCGRSLHFLADPDEADALRGDERFAASPHHGDRGWFALPIDDDTDWTEVAELLRSAHARVCPTDR